MPHHPSEGIFFVVRLPDGWQLCTFRFDEFEELGLPDLWLEVLSSTLRVWLHHFRTNDPDNFKEHHAAIEDVLSQLVAGYDVFPRGSIHRPKRKGARWKIRFTGQFPYRCGVTRREVEEVFGIVKRARWVADPEHVCTCESVDRFRAVFLVEERWKCSPENPV